MYFHDNFSDYAENALFAGFSEPRDTGPIGAIEAALKLDPSGGYVKGTVPRQRLEAAFNSVPINSAAALLAELNQGASPLAKLFHYRLHHATRQTMFDILKAKSDEQKANLAKSCQDLQRLMADSARLVKEYESAVERICKLRGENSDACLKARFDLDGARMRHDDRLRQVRSLCP